MKFAIIAAGEGSRLAEEGISAPKPLIPLCGTAMIERLVRIFAANDAEEIVIIVNRLRPETESFVRRLADEHPEWNLRIEVETTPSSMHSFARIAPLLDGAPFCLTTVDTIFREEDFRAYIAAFRSALEAGLDGLMAVTDFIDDESPLYIGTDEALNIDGFYDTREPRFRFISGGIYALAPPCARHPASLHGRRPKPHAQLPARPHRRRPEVESPSLLQNPRRRPRRRHSQSRSLSPRLLIRPAPL